MALLEVKDVHASYGDSAVLRGVSLRIDAGEVVSMLGRNGMGKSTTVRTIMGALRASAGEVLFQGQSTRGKPMSAVACLGLGWVPEGRRIFANLSVEENLIVAQRDSPSAREPWNAARVYGLFPRLQERRRNMGNQLSGGEQQMLAIGRALTTNPALLILDEATEGLAPVIRQEIWAALAVLKQAGQSILIIDKHLKALSTLADRNYLIEKGRIVWSGDRQALLSEMATVRALLSVSA
jgi:branched-chain amino acid transport system ATP-binding protein